MKNNDTSVLVSDLVAEKPSRSRLFERLGVDYCCGGNRPLDEVCRERGLDAKTLLETLRATESVGIGGEQEKNWFTASVEELISDITNVHHAFLRREFPRLSELVTRVVESHSEREPRLLEVRDNFQELVAELEPHLDLEENEVFPHIIEVTAARDTSEPGWKHEEVDRNPPLVSAVDRLESEHRSTAERLSRIQVLTDGYKAPAWACNSFRALYDGFRELTANIHEHVHKENNILFPTVRKALGR